MKQILLVDDDVDLTLSLGDYLEAEGFGVQRAHDGQAGVSAALDTAPAAVVMDVNMPVLNGIDALCRIRQSSQVPVLLMTSRDDDIDRIIGLELGADDYIGKPCSPRELVARLRAIFRRLEPRSATPTLTIGKLALQPENRSATWAGRPLTLTGAEFDLLAVLVRHAGNVVSKADLCQAGLGRPLTRYDRSVDVHLSRLRQKLGLLAEERSLIQAIRGKGYQLVVGD